MLYIYIVTASLSMDLGTFRGHFYEYAGWGSPGVYSSCQGRFAHVPRV